MNNEKFEKLDNDQKELVKYWIDKLIIDNSSPIFSREVESFIEKHLTPEPVIEVGKWYKTKNPKKHTLFFVEQIESDKHGFIKSNICYGFSYIGEWINKGFYSLEESLVTDFTEATPEEVEQRLIEEAKRRGYKPGMAIESLFSMSNYRVSPIAEYVYTHKHNDIVYGGVWIYKNGKWAEIIDEKSELRETIAKLRTELSTLEAQL